MANCRSACVMSLHLLSLSMYSDYRSKGQAHCTFEISFEKMFGTKKDGQGTPKTGYSSWPSRSSVDGYAVLITFSEVVATVPSGINWMVVLMPFRTISTALSSVSTMHTSFPAASLTASTRITPFVSLLANLLTSNLKIYAGAWCNPHNFFHVSPIAFR